MNDAASLLVTYAAGYGIEITREQEERFRIYARMLVEWNEKINLTAILDPEGIAAKHFLDSLLILKAYSPARGEKAIDIGTGAGFPGIPLKIMRPDLELTLLDALNKRLIFLSELLKALGLEARLVHARAEEASRQKEHRMRYGFAAARAVAVMPVLCEYCLPFLKQGGVFAAMKGPISEEENERAEKAAKALGCKTEKPIGYGLPAGDRRSLYLFHRVGALAEKYPRHGSKIAKQPL